MKFNEEFYIDKAFYNQLLIMLESIKTHNQDLVIVLDGPEGAGKSTFARQIGYVCAHYLKSHFDTEGTGNIHNDITKYITSSYKGGKHFVNILDEARQVANKRRSISKSNVRFTNYLSECRFMNQVHIICIPAFHDLDRYVAQWRMNLLVHIKKNWERDEKRESGYGLDLGKYKVWSNNTQLRNSYDAGGFTYPYKAPIHGIFPNHEILTDKGIKKYEEQKTVKIEEKYVSEENQETPQQIAINRELEIIANMVSRGFTRDNMAVALGYTVRTIDNRLAELRKKERI